MCPIVAGQGWRLCLDRHGLAGPFFVRACVPGLALNSLQRRGRAGSGKRTAGEEGRGVTRDFRCSSGRKALAGPLGANCCLTRAVTRKGRGEAGNSAGIKAGRFVASREGEAGEVCNRNLVLGEQARSALRDELRIVLLRLSTVRSEVRICRIASSWVE